MPTPRNNNDNAQNRGRKQPVTVSGYQPGVLDMMRQKYPDFDNVMKGGQQQAMAGAPNGNIPPVAPSPNMNFFGGGNSAVGKYEAQPQQTSAAPTTDFTNMPTTPQFKPQTAGNANPTVGPVASPYMKDAAETTPQAQSNFEGMQVPNNGAQWNPLEQNSDVGYKGAPYDPSKYDSLSAALNGGASVQSQQVPEFHADPSQRDGGFFGWLSGLIPKNRPGMREGETPDEYDRRITTNMQRLATLTDAFRHLGNIINTAKGAPLQQFNDPNTMLEQGYQNRKAERAKKAAADADAAYKQANMTLKERAAEADRAYKELSLGLKQQAAERAAKSDDFNQRYKEAGLQRQLDNDKFNHDLAGKKFDETKRHNEVSEGQSAARIALAQERNGIARARLAHSIATGGGSKGGKGGSLTNLSSPSGHLNRKKDLNSIEKKQITQHLIQNGYIDKKNLDAYKMYQSMGNTQLANDLQNYWIAYAANMPGRKGDAFRTMLKNHYMYGETNTVSTPKPKAQPKATPKKTASKPVGGGVSGGKSKNGYKNTKALGL